MSTLQERLKFELSRFKRFLSVFMGSKNGFMGLVILFMFGVAAAAAPLITPYDPVVTMGLAAPNAAPSWLRTLPPEIGGQPYRSENFAPLQNPVFANDVSEVWNYNSTSPYITQEWIENVQGKSGVATFKFSRTTTGEAYGTNTLTLYQDFTFPYTGPPGAFFGDIAVLFNGTFQNDTITYKWYNPGNATKEHFADGDGVKRTFSLLHPPLIVKGSEKIYVDGVQQTNRTDYTISYLKATVTFTVPPANGAQLEADYEYTFAWKTEIRYILDVPITVNVFVTRLSDNKTWVLWPLDSPAYIKLDPQYLPKGMSANGTMSLANSTRWINTADMPFSSTHPSISIFFQGAAEETIFGQDYVPGTYRYGINISFEDLNSTIPVSAQLYLDTLNFRFWGNSFGVLGTDSLGRDIFSQLVYGTRISLYVGLLSTIIGVVIGLLVGLAAGYMGRTVDEVLMRFNDMLLVLPTLPLLIVLMAVLSPSLETLILVLGFLGWMGFARLVRSQVLSLKERPFVEAAKAIGAGKTHIMMRHILPNVMSLVYVTLATSVPGNIVAEAALSWLGFFDPYRMSWGRMLYDVQYKAQAVTNWWWVVPPGLAIAALALSFIMLGFALDNTLNPKLRMRR